MADYDLIVRNAKIVTAERQSEGDIAVKDGKVAALGADVKGTATREIDAAGKFVLPGGVDSHCHIEQRSGMGVMCADDFYTGTVSAAFGGTTTVIPFAAQHRGMSLRQVVKDYHEAATPKAVIDYAFHLIITDPTQQVLGQELPALIKDGYTSFKIYMTYDAMKVSDYQILDILALARRDGALVMVHAENHDMIQWLAHHLVDQGHVAPKFHAIAHARVAEAEATNRAISLARLVDAPLLIVHMSEIEAIETLRQAQKKGAEDLRRDLPAIHRAHRRRHGQARRRGRDVVLQPAAARFGSAGGGVGRAEGRHLPDLLVRPRALSVQREGQDSQGRQDDLQGDGQRRAGPGDPPADPVLRGRAEGPHHPAAVRGADLGQPRQALRPLSARRARSPSAPTPTSRSGTPTRT